MDKTLHLILVRHGNTFESHEVPVMVGKKSDLPLTHKGEEQAALVADWLKTHHPHISSVYSGSLKRQIQTAQIIKRTAGALTTHYNFAGLDEIDYGPWEGLSPEDIESKWPDLYRAYSNAGEWPESVFKESFEHRVNIIKHWVNQLLSSHKDDDVVVGVSSQGIIRLFLHLIPELWDDIATRKIFKDYKVGTGHICEFALRRTGCELLEWNVSPHL